MVGVTGKSKACQECKTRRLKCDLARPGCRRCAKARITCSGYLRRTLFINSTPQNPEVRVMDALAAAQDPNPVHDLAFVESVGGEYAALANAYASGSYGVVDFRMRIWAILRELYLPKPAYIPDSGVSGAFTWVAAVCRCPQASETLDASLLAFCASQLYVSRMGSMGLNDALRVYSDGLRKLSWTLQAVESTSSLMGVLASIVTLSTCELVISPASPGWRAHVNGIAEVIQLQDFMGGDVSSEYIELCARARIISVLATMMSDGKGRRVPALQWRKILDGRMKSDHLGDLLDLVSDMTTVLELSETPEYQLIAMLRSVEKVYEWEEDFVKKVGRPPYHFVSAQMQNPADQNHDEVLFPLVLEFHSLLVSSCLIVSWSIVLHAITIILRIHKVLAQADTAIPQASHDIIWRFLDRSKFKGLDAHSAICVEATRRAQLLCQCVEYTHKPEMGCVGPQTMTYARWVLIRYFTQQKRWRELSWCRNIANMTNNDGKTYYIRLGDFHA